MGPRVLAGLLDGLALAGLGLGLFVIPMFLGGLAIPTWAALAAILGYAVVPLWAFQATPFMRLFGLELVRRDGTAPDPIDILFREILARGLGPAAYLLTFLFALVGSAVGRVGVSSPLGGAGLSVAILVCLGAVGVAALGQVLALFIPDRRTLADVVARTNVIPRAAVAVEQGADPEEQEERRARRRARVRNVVIFEVLLVGLMIGGPLVAAKAPRAQRQAYAAHLNLEADQRRFEANPVDPVLAQSLSRDYLEAGETERAARVEAQQRAALKEANAKREAALRAALQANPKDDDASGALIDLLEEEDRAEEARSIREAVLRADGSPEAQAAYGLWLYQRDANAEAVAHLAAALDGGFDVPDVHAYLGFALRELGRKAEARAELQRALAMQPDLDEVAEDVEDLNAELGPAPEPPPKKPDRHGKK